MYVIYYICLCNILTYVYTIYLLSNTVFILIGSKVMHVGRIKIWFVVQLILTEMGCFIGGFPIKEMFMCVHKRSSEGQPHRRLK